MQQDSMLSSNYRFSDGYAHNLRQSIFGKEKETMNSIVGNTKMSNQRQHAKKTQVEFQRYHYLEFLSAEESKPKVPRRSSDDVPNPVPQASNMDTNSFYSNYVWPMNSRAFISNNQVGFNPSYIWPTTSVPLQAKYPTTAPLQDTRELAYHHPTNHPSNGGMNGATGNPGYNLPSYQAPNAFNHYCTCNRRPSNWPDFACHRFPSCTSYPETRIVSSSNVTMGCDDDPPKVIVKAACAEVKKRRSGMKKGYVSGNPPLDNVSCVTRRQNKKKKEIFELTFMVRHTQYIHSNSNTLTVTLVTIT